MRTSRPALPWPLLALLAACGATERPDSTTATSTAVATTATTPAGDGRFLFVFAANGKHSTMGAGHTHDSVSVAADTVVDSDFLAVIDSDTSSATYAQVVATAPTGAVGTMPHHIELEMPTGGRPLVASAYGSGRAYLFDLTDPKRPRITGTLDTVPGLRTPHSFVRLPDGNVLATMQFGDARAKGKPGGLALFSPEGRVVRSGRSADPTMPGAAIRTYALDVAPTTDRVITTSSPMDTERSADVVQLWRLSDLALLRTIPVPRTTTDTMWHYPFELRFLPDGKTAFMNTYYCAFYAMSGLDGETPEMERVLALQYPRYNGCGVPLLIGRWWIMPVTDAREFVVLDISNPRRPRVASTLPTDSTFSPHWITREPNGTRLVATSDGPKTSVRLLQFDSTSGRLTWDERFRERPGGPLGVSFERATWPHGAAGRAVPHGAVFSRGPARPAS
ncbi:MAG: hypothetical protein ABIP93_16895 [Gemmatimonadaceae bacterium]